MIIVNVIHCSGFMKNVCILVFDVRRFGNMASPDGKLLKGQELINQDM